MRSPVLLLLAAFIGMVSGTIYFKNGNMQAVQTQANLILHAFKQQNIDLLYELIPFEHEIDRFLKNSPYEIVSAEVQNAVSYPGGLIKGIVLINEASGRGYNKSYMATVTLSLSNTSPTGYIMSKGLICKQDCVLQEDDLVRRPIGFFY